MISDETKEKLTWAASQVSGAVKEACADSDEDIVYGIAAFAIQPNGSGTCETGTLLEISKNESEGGPQLRTLLSGCIMHAAKAYGWSKADVERCIQLMTDNVMQMIREGRLND